MTARAPLARRRWADWPGSGDRGSATVLVAAACAVSLLIGGAGSLAVGAAVAASRARTAADLSALAGAGALVTHLRTGVGSDPCVAAAEVATRNGAEMRACGVDGSVNVTVEVAVPPPRVWSWPFAIGTAAARARAGPAAPPT